MTKRVDKRGQGPKQSPLPDVRRDAGARGKRFGAIDRLRGRFGRENRA